MRATNSHRLSKTACSLAVVLFVTFALAHNVFSLDVSASRDAAGREFLVISGI